MFEELFKDPRAIERYQTAPLCKERLRYLRYRAESGSTPSTLKVIANSQLCLVHLLNLTDGETVSISQVKAAATKWTHPTGAQFGRTIPASAMSISKFIGRCVRWLRFLKKLEERAVVTHAHSGEVAAYEAWMRDERGLSEATIGKNLYAVDAFFNWLTTRDTPLNAVKITDIDSAIASKNARGHYSRTTIRIYAYCLRSFFRFAEDRGWCTSGMAVGVIPPRLYPQEGVPAGLARDDVQRLLATTEGGRPADKRDRAILMLLVAYGLRSGEIRGLRLNDVDWERETLRVYCSKPRRTNVYPLSRGVGQAILRYILEVRPSRPERSLFFSVSDPIQPLTSSQVYYIVSRRLRRLGIVTGRRGPHALRHAVAQRLLDHGMSMKVIGDYLGHRNPSTTAIYAKVDLKSLREVADFDLGSLV